MAFVSLPFLINSARDGFAAIPERLEKPPLIWEPAVQEYSPQYPSPRMAKHCHRICDDVCTGMSEFGAVVIIAYHPMIAPVLIYDRFSSFGLKYARPAAVLFIVVALIVFTFLRLLSERRNLLKKEVSMLILKNISRNWAPSI